jgi:urease accessory protein
MSANNSRSMPMPRGAESLVALLHLASPALPVGGFSYSQGLEHAIDTGAVPDAAATLAWIEDVVDLVLPSFELPMLLRLHAAVRDGDLARATTLDDRFIASRDSAELRAETLQMGYSLIRLLGELDRLPTTLEATRLRSWPAAFACACFAMDVDARDGAIAYAWSFVENQVLVAVKTVPLGQVAGQRMLIALGPRIPAAVDRAFAIDDDALASSSPRLAWHSARHETQYSRLFRS